MMDVTNPRVAATQFTAYMAMMNLAIAIAAQWQGIAAEVLGYPLTLLLDAIVGPLCVFLLPSMKRPAVFSDALAARRSRNCAIGLGIACLAWVPYWAGHAAVGRAQPILSVFFTLVFIASALFLLAGREVLADAAGWWRRAALWVAPLLILMYARTWLDKLSGVPALHLAAQALMVAVPLAAGIVLLALAKRDWRAAADMQPTHST
jgi:PAT family beta-lactamase induction signal transducer AmpG